MKSPIVKLKDGHVRLRMPTWLKREAERRARAAGTTASEWWRVAALEKIERDDVPARAPIRRSAT